MDGKKLDKEKLKDILIVKYQSNTKQYLKDLQASTKSKEKIHEDKKIYYRLHYFRLSTKQTLFLFDKLLYLFRYDRTFKNINDK